MPVPLIAPEQIDMTSIKAQIGDKNYVHYQSNHGGASTEWLVEHNLGKKPSVSITDTEGREMIAAIEHISNNALYIRFKYDNNGIAICN